MSRIVTLDEFILRRQKDFPLAKGELTGLLRDIGIAAKIVNREVNKAGLLSVFGVSGHALHACMLRCCLSPSRLCRVARPPRCIPWDMGQAYGGPERCHRG